MIARNEAERLSTALAHWRELGDELIVVDNGSTDGTPALARELGATIIEADPALDDMSAWRNMALEAAQHSDWVIMLDADQEVSEPASLRSQLESQPPGVTGCYLQYHNIVNGQVVLAWHELRAMRPAAYRYKYREHETPIAQSEAAHEVTLPVVIRHYPRQNEAKSDAQLRRLTQSVEEHPNDPHPRYFLARLLAARGEYQQAISHFDAYLSMATPQHDVCEVYGHLATCYSGLGDANRAVICLQNCLIHQPQRRVWWIRVAEIYRGLGLHNIALAYLRGAAELIPAPEQHAQPMYTGYYLYELIHACQLEQHAQGHHHG